MRDTSTAPGGGVGRGVPWLLVLPALLLAAVVRIRLMDLPLERDEGGFAYAAQLLLDGVPPYQLNYDMRMPGTYLAYAAFMAIGGETREALHLGLLAVNLATITLVFLLARRLFDATAGVAAAWAYALLSLSSSVLGLAAHTTHFVALPAVAGAYLLARKSARDIGPAALLLAGLLMGTAFVTKQTIAPLGVFGGLWLCGCEWRSHPRRWKRSAWRVGGYAVGCVLPAALVCLWLWWEGVFPRFWFWTVTYAREYGAQVPLARAPERLWYGLRWVTAPAPALWGLAAAGCLVVLASDRLRTAGVFALGLLVASFLAVCPGFYFREHHFIVMLPALAVMAGVALSALRSALAESRLAGVARAGVLAVVGLAAFGAPVWLQWDLFFRLSPIQASRRIYGQSPFIESIQIADYLRASSTANARIAVLGSEPQLNFYAKRRSATGYVYMYGLMEPHPYALEMQHDMIAEIEAVRPEFLVLVNFPHSWLMHPESPQALISWSHAYARQHYRLVGVVDLISEDRIEYRWDDAAVDYRPESEHNVLVMRRK